MVTQLMDAPIAFIEKEFPGQLRQEYGVVHTLFHVQPANVQRMLELQARLIAKAVDEGLSPIHFVLPDQVICTGNGKGQDIALTVPEGMREQKVGGLMDRIESSDLYQWLAELEASRDKGVTISASLVRYAVATYIVHDLLPAGRQVTDPVTEVENVPYARRFFKPQWVAFDDHDNLLVDSVSDAEAHIASMQRYMTLLQAAATLAPYIVVDNEYQLKRSGMLRQLVNQGCSLARYKTGEAIRIIHKRLAAGNLNRGLSLSLPYFDDHSLKLRYREIQVIPAGRILFVPAFVVIASRMEQIKVEHDPELSPSTRKHLLEELKFLELAFERNHDGNSLL